MSLVHWGQDTDGRNPSRDVNDSFSKVLCEGISLLHETTKTCTDSTSRLRVSLSPSSNLTELENRFLLSDWKNNKNNMTSLIKIHRLIPRFLERKWNNQSYNYATIGTGFSINLTVQFFERLQNREKRWSKQGITNKILFVLCGCWHSNHSLIFAHSKRQKFLFWAQKKDGLRCTHRPS